MAIFIIDGYGYLHVPLNFDRVHKVIMDFNSVVHDCHFVND